MGNHRPFALGEWDARISWALAVLDCVVVWISAWRPIGPILQGARMVAFRLAISLERARLFQQCLRSQSAKSIGGLGARARNQTTINMA